ncbi:GDSL-type esterase/lipase family protein [Paenibacillus sp. IHBB 10380]|uniref:GDSL-type esterase/lipase family protein n=1 Tax=Paenibacillus sp. IHBB 10380 TaxID=1566358 RepID=UPI0005CF9882|nr:GDSL-type esterase/lipase family protein [Paenibacillus sp. IHBB 10380]AJS59284.1 lysophospholipase [Paenibacillus sp. IHBB 10380]
MVYHYTAIGDSLTVGYGALPGNGFVPVYRRLAEYHFQTFVACDNLGINGLTTQGQYDLISRNLSFRQSLQRSDIITLSIGGNDLIRAAKLLGATSQHFNKALSECQANFGRIIKGLYHIKRNTNQSYIIRVIGLYNPLPQVVEASYYVQQFNQYIERYQSRTLAVANIYPLFHGRERELLSLDHVHPNSRGYRIIADQLNRLEYRPLG